MKALLKEDFGCSVTWCAWGKPCWELHPSPVVLLPLKEKRRCCIFTKIHFCVLSVAVFVRYKKNSKYPQPLKNQEC